MIQITDKTKCCGCTACCSICPQKCITMLRDEEGFSYPSVDNAACIKCGACERVCPVCENNHKPAQTSLFAAVQCQDENIRSASTAGGAFSMIADELLAAGGVVYAVGYDDKTVVTHKRVTTIEELQDLRGSKYVQSRLGDTFRHVKEDLAAGHTVLFVGTPCQVHGLVNYVGKSEKLYTVDLLCLGVTSPGLFEKYVWYLEEKYQSHVTAVRFRDKHYGYATPNVRICFEDGKYIEQKYDSKVHANLFFKHYYNVRPSCYECRFREVPRVSDFTIGDFTEIGTVNHGMDDDKGTTKLWAHTEKAKQLLQGLAQDNTVFVVDNEAFNTVGGPKRQIQRPEKRDEFFRDAGSKAYRELIQKWEPNSLKGILAGRVRKILRILPYGKLISKAMRKRRAKQYQRNVDSINGGNNG